ncbi:MAG TPA: ATP synthase F1 subunit delta [Alphaproteobacteria bacterium]|nr:ATP synthase F1 subunit delta [Alphaproteobacteria bacterium]
MSTLSASHKPLPVEAQRYAEALYELAVQHKSLAEVEGDLLRLKAFLAGSRELRLFLSSPLLRRTLTAKGLEAVLEKAEVSKLTRNFFRIAAMNGRGRDIPKILEAFFNLTASRRGELRAEVTSAHPLTEAQSKALETALLKAFSKQGAREIRLEKHTDSGLLGGLRVQVGSFLFDGSLKGQLGKLGTVLK